MVKQVVMRVMALALFAPLAWGVTPSVGKATKAVSKGGSGTASTQAVPEPKGDQAVGGEKAESERCIECHGLDGQGALHPNSAEGKFAKLAGQHPAYILKQIRDFRSGARQHDQMAIMARSVEDADVRDIAAYFNAQKPMTGADGQVHERGRALFEKGDPGRGIVACASCHGADGKGNPATPLIPVIGGQEWRYLDKQLRDWRAGDRRNSPDGVMNKVTSALSDREIEALADYLAGI